MTRNLPFASLRSFEAVARRRSFSRAAEELNVTQSAVSQHVRALESWVNCTLIRRGASGSSPTAQGRVLAEAVAAGFGRIAAVCGELQNRGRREAALKVACPPGLAVNWLLPRLHRFDEAHPEVPVSITTTTAGLASPLDECEADVAISYGLGDHRGMHVEALLPEALEPVCSPKLARDTPLRAVADLANATRLTDTLEDHGGDPPTWSFWADQVGVKLPPVERVRRFAQSNMVVQAAIEGLGVALGRSPLVEQAVADGRLVRPLGLSAASNYAYWFVCDRSALELARVAAFRAWLRQEAGDGEPRQR